jgi:methyl-accepting chemotaxis protein
MIKMLFSTLWWFGFIVAIALMIGLYFQVSFIQNYVGGLFLLVGVQHMIVLVILGFFAIREKEDNIEIGNRVATMGYLHTLIGTSVALIMTAHYGSEVIEHVESIIAPIGSSLITSIIGWAFGKEMERDKYRFKLSAEEETSNALEFLAQKVLYSAQIIEESSKAWGETINASTKEIHDTTQLLENELKRTSEYSQKIITDSLTILQEQFEQIEQSSQLMKNQFDRTSSDAGKVFRASVDTFDTGLSQMNDIAKEWDKHLKTMKRFSTHSESAMEQLSHTSQKVIDEISTIAHSLPKAGKMISDLDDFIAKLKEKDNNS